LKFCDFDHIALWTPQAILISGGLIGKLLRGEEVGLGAKQLDRFPDRPP